MSDRMGMNRLVATSPISDTATEDNPMTYTRDLHFDRRLLAALLVEPDRAKNRT